MPPDFPDFARNRSIVLLCRHYRAGNLAVKRWLSSLPDIPRPKPGTRPQPLRKSFRVISRINDPTYRLIESCVPNGYAPDLRADMISDLYLAVLDGKLRADELLEHGRAILNQTLRDCGVEQWRIATSLDSSDDDQGDPLVERLVDDAAQEAFDRLFSDEEFEDF